MKRRVARPKRSAIRDRIDEELFLEVLRSVDVDIEPSGHRWCEVLLRMIKEVEDGHFPVPRNFDVEILERSGDLICVDCGKQVPEYGPYCGEFCQQLAGTVRYVRKAAGDGRLSTDACREGLEQRIIAQLKGGYPAKARFLTKAQRQTIFTRDDYQCQLCPNAATEIDHICGDSSDPSNLRALCGPCNRKLASAVRLNPSDQEREAAYEIAYCFIPRLALRIAAPLPLSACDNYERWRRAEPNLRSQRKRLRDILLLEEDDDFEDVDDYLWHSMQKDD
jgi:5-methylcytosine-specific restriction endonuclease McrA